MRFLEFKSQLEVDFGVCIFNGKDKCSKLIVGKLKDAEAAKEAITEFFQATKQATEVVHTGADKLAFGIKGKIYEAQKEHSVRINIQPGKI